MTDVHLSDWDSKVKSVHKVSLRTRPPFLTSNPKLSGSKQKNFFITAQTLPSLFPEEMSESFGEHGMKCVNSSHVTDKYLEQPMEFHILELSPEFCVGVDKLYITHMPTREYLGHTLCREEVTESRYINKLTILDTDCIVFGHHWGDGFQHGTQDIFPKLFTSKFWLSENPHISIVIPKNLDILWWMKREGMFSSLKNNIIMIDTGHVTSTKKLYGSTITPGQVCEFTPWSMISYSACKTTKIPPINKYLIYLCREGTSMRVPTNKSDITKCLLEYCEKEGLEYLCINPSDMSREQLEVKMINARGVVAPHGGANYNVLFMKRSKYDRDGNEKGKKDVDPKRFFIECVVKNGCHHTYHIALAARVGYLAIPCEGNHYEKDMFVNIDMLKASLENFS